MLPRTILVATLALAACRAPSPSSAPEPQFSVAESRAELAELYERLEASHFDLFAHRPKAEYDAFFEQLRQSFTRPQTRFELEVAFQRFAAFGRVAHARVDFPAAAFEAFREAGGKVLPLFVRVVDGTVLVSENASGLDSLAVGDELLALDGEPLPALLARLEAHVSADTPYLAHTQLEMRFPALVWLELGERPRFTLELRRGGAAPFTVVVPARTRAEMQQVPPSPAFELDWDRREARLLGDGIAYLRPGPFYDNTPGATNIWDSTSFEAFLDGAFRSFLAAGAQSLIVDLRNNPGGDNSFSDPLVAWFATEPFRFTSDFRVRVSQAAIDSNRQRIEAGETDPASTSQRYAALYAKAPLGTVVPFEMPLVSPRQGERFSGKVYLLINRHSYSNTVTVAALAQDYHFATILGEETSDLASTYGAMEQFQLSRTGIPVGFPKARILRPNGNPAARGVVPDVAIPTPLVPGAEDEVLARAVEVVRGRG